jgi:hypothetical protein
MYTKFPELLAIHSFLRRKIAISDISLYKRYVGTLLNLRPKKRRKIGKFTVAKIRHFIEKPDDWSFQVAQYFF